MVIVLSETIDRTEGLEDSGFHSTSPEFMKKVCQYSLSLFLSLSLSRCKLSFSRSVSQRVWLFLSHFVSESLTLSLALRLRDSFSRTFSERLCLDRNLVLWNTRRCRSDVFGMDCIEIWRKHSFLDWVLSFFASSGVLQQPRICTALGSWRKKERKKENKPTTAEIKQDKLCKIKSVAEIYLYDSAS